MSTAPPTPPTPSTNQQQTDPNSTPDNVVEPGDSFDVEPDEGAVEEVEPPSPSAAKDGKTQKDESSFSTTSMMDRVKDKASKASDAMGKRARRIQHRSASHDAERASAFVERITSEVTATIKGALQTTTALLVGGTYGTVSGAVKGTLPIHAKLLQQSDQLHLAGTWSRFQKGIQTDEGLIDVFEVDFNENTAEILGLGDDSSGSYPVHSDAVTTTIKEPGTGETVDVIASPVYERESDRLIGVLAFVGEGEHEGRILVSLEHGE